MDNTSKHITQQMLMQLQEQFLLSLFELVIQQGAFDELTKLKLFLKNVSSPQQLNHFTDNLSKLQKLNLIHIILDNQKVRINYFLSPEEKLISEFQKQVLEQQDDSFNRMIDCITNKPTLQQLILDFRYPNIYLNDCSFENWPIYFENANNLTHLELYFNCNYKKQRFDNKYLTCKSIKYINWAIQKCKHQLKHLVVSFEGYFFQLLDQESQEYKDLDQQCKTFFIDKLTFPDLKFLNVKIPFSSIVSPYPVAQEFYEDQSSKLITLILDSNWIDKQFLAKYLMKCQQINNIKLNLENLTQPEFTLICNCIKQMKSIVRVQITSTLSFNLNIISIFQFYRALIESKHLSTFRLYDSSKNNQLVLSEKLILLRKKYIYLIKAFQSIGLQFLQIQDLISRFSFSKHLFAESIWLKIALLTRKNVQSDLIMQNQDPKNQQYHLIKSIEKQISINWKFNKMVN